MRSQQTNSNSSEPTTTNSPSGTLFKVPSIGVSECPCPENRRRLTACSLPLDKNTEYMKKHMGEMKARFKK